MVDLDKLLLKLKSIRREIRAQYTEPDTRPWIIGFSGGKDSTLLTHLVVEALLSVAPDQRIRPVFIVCNDTLVESSVFHSFVEKMLTQIEENVGGLNVPAQVVRTHPLPEESFWVNLLGRGYPAPNRTFRWCTDRMKIRPTSRFIREQVSHAGEAILLLGVRSSESATRAGSVARHAEKAVGRLSPHPDHKGVAVLSPIKDLETDEVWTTLLAVRPPWGGTYRDVVTLYKNALGGECPFVVSNDDAPSCGTNSARFGCWTCTVVKRTAPSNRSSLPARRPPAAGRLPQAAQSRLGKPRVLQQNPPQRPARPRPAYIRSPAGCCSKNSSPSNGSRSCPSFPITRSGSFGSNGSETKSTTYSGRSRRKLAVR
jgi:DNA sulfur modification protein DndC